MEWMPEVICFPWIGKWLYFHGKKRWCRNLQVVWQNQQIIEIWGEGVEQSVLSDWGVGVDVALPPVYLPKIMREWNVSWNENPLSCTDSECCGGSPERDSLIYKFIPQSSWFWRKNSAVQWRKSCAVQWRKQSAVQWRKNCAVQLLECGITPGFGQSLTSEVEPVQC